MKRFHCGLAAALIACGHPGAQPLQPQPSNPSEPVIAAPAHRAEPAVPVHAPKAPIAIAEYFKIKKTSGASFNHDETLIAYQSNESGRTDLWVRPVSGQGPAKQVTHAKGFVGAFEFSPTQDVLAFTADVGGTELMGLYLTDATGKEPVAVFPDEPKTSRVDFAGWARDGKTFLYISSRRDPNYQDLYEYDLATKKSTLLWQASGKLSFGGASRDHKVFAIGETISDVDSNIYVMKRGDKAPALVTKHTGNVQFSLADFSLDDKTMLVTSDRDGEFMGLYALDLATKKLKPVTTPSWDVDSGGWSVTGKYRYAAVNNDGSYDVTLTDTKTDKPVALPAGIPGVLNPIAFSKSDRFFAGRLESDTAPNMVWIVDLKDGKARPLYDPMPETLRGVEFVRGEVVRVKSFDGKEVPAFVYKPKTAGPHPAVLDIHGGPTAQSRRQFAWMRQYLVSKGYVVMVPNVRGSTGYGKTYTAGDNKDLGGGPLEDVIACKKWLVANAGVDANKVAIIGGSYGGYMTLAAAAFKPTEFAAHVDIFGVSDLKSLVESFPAYWMSGATYIYQKFGDPKNPADAKYQHDRSPLNYVDKIQRPLLVIQGTNDARVKKDQSDRVVEALRKRNIPVDYLVIPDEGHGFSTTAHEQLAIETADRFLDKHIFGDTEVKVIP